MKKFIMMHEEIIKNWIQNKDSITKEMLEYHEKQIAYLQNERLTHLIVLVTFAFLTLFGVNMLLAHKSLIFGIFTLLCLVLLIPYINFYYLLENGIQRWYDYARLLDKFENKPYLKTTLKQ